MSRIAEDAYGDTPAPYPTNPGFKEPTTSQDAAVKMKSRAETLRAKVMFAIEMAPTGLTPDEAAGLLGESVLAVRPRVTELKRLGLIEKTGERRRNVSCMSASVWRKKA